MIPNENCIFEYGNRKCQKHDLTSFEGVICANHLLDVFGDKAIYRESQQPDAVVKSGPYLAVAENVVFETNTVLFPCRDFIDKQLGYLDNRKKTIETKNYRLNKMTLSFLNAMISTKSNPANMFQFEILRNLFVRDPSTDVNMALGADNTKTSLRNQVQTRLNNLRTFIENQDWHNYFVDESIQVYNVDGTERKKDELSAFEKFLLFNVHHDKLAVLTDEMEISRLNLNTVYIPSVGYTTVKTLYHPSDLVFHADSILDQTYDNYKTNWDLKQISKNTRSMPDRQNRTNLLDTTSICRF
jgi:hypothetical protein